MACSVQNNLTVKPRIHVIKPRIHVIVDRSDGHRSEAEIEGTKVTSDMLDSAEDLLHTLTTGERPALKNLYDLVARAFGTTQADVKERITAAAYGMSSQMIEQRMLSNEAGRVNGRSDL